MRFAVSVTGCSATSLGGYPGNTAPRTSEFLQQIDGAPCALGGFTHPGRQLTGAGGVLRGKDRPQIGNESFGVALENRRDVPTFSCLTREPHIGWSPAVQRISEGIPARRPAAVVPEPP